MGGVAVDEVAEEIEDEVVVADEARLDESVLRIQIAVRSYADSCRGSSALDTASHCTDRAVGAV